jgi:serine/threonine protein kinase
MWSIGCVMSELFKKTPLFPYNEETLIVNAIYKACGTPDVKTWPEVKLLPRFSTFIPKNVYVRKIRQKFELIASTLAIDLIDKLLVLNPSNRITACEALNSEWILKMEKILISPLCMKLPFIDCFEMNMRHKRKQNKVSSKMLKKMRKHLL